MGGLLGGIRSFLLLASGLMVAGVHAASPPAGEAQAVSPRIATARLLTSRDVGRDAYKSLFFYRQRRAVEVVLADPEVNRIARGWVASFEAYDPLTNDLDSVSLQGSTDMRVQGDLENGFEITAAGHQVVYALVDRRYDQIVALTVTRPKDVTWKRIPKNEGPDAVARHRAVLQDARVKAVLEGKPWYPMVKVAEVITAYKKRPLRTVTPAIYYFKENGKLAVLSVFLDVRDPKNMKVVDVNVIRRFTEYPSEELARAIVPRARSVLGRVPEVPFAKRPWYTAPEGFHRQELPPREFVQDRWRVRWSPPETQGVDVSAWFRGKPVLRSLLQFTFTGYNLPPQNGRPTLRWYFPEGAKYFAGELLYWDIHSADFGGPGLLGKIPIPATADHPGGFRMRSHYHTGALPHAQDFHAGHRFGPYNYDVAYDFFADGVVRLEWRRNGPGYVTEFLRVRRPTSVYQCYLSVWGLDLTPGTTQGVRVELFDGRRWTSPRAEFYVVGRPGMVVRVKNPRGSEAVEIPLDENVEVAVVRAKRGEIGRSKRVLDEAAETRFYHPGQYADGEPIQGQQVITWIVLHAPIHDLALPAGISAYPVFVQLNLRGY
ncbi:MAG: hypothetical protein QN182_00295 [Armatimonadota bacterium]|nr:hypothetical protein [Armatimonadota bacterium]